MKITTRHHLTELIAKRLYDDSCINEMEEFSDSDRNWKTAEGIVSFFLDEAGDEPLWAREKRREDYDKYRIFIRNYETNATDLVRA